MKSKPGPKTAEGKLFATCMSFSATMLELNGNHIAINISQFLTSLADNLRQQLLDSETQQELAAVLS